ncbi:hypothetical protein [Clostridium botulinum]|uniref:hypothetical protein n=1 Tax=Clostridium botulinum TaxID=1491 RepID=UPI00030A965C|nr:hypothetical protein [Clostridium botulinum]KEH96728.1 hypothetical protein Z953_13990 [Clostridium botulinum D str. 16868]KLU74564.1 hypothetical protein CBC3_13595 [Clostridium botulinum V891]MCD3254858.1 hypothetical protein [Clostridium botulinum C/D]MCD3280344.1 hypothetical protein [Clostridium botulinum C/D]MCD3282641.1 hypothetical protein [Clostridium botulinum C/D]
MDVKSDKYILGQSTSKTISNQSEIRLDLSLETNTTQLLLGPQYDSFTIASQGYIPPIEINATKGILGGSASIAPNGQFVQGLGVSFAAEVNIIIYTMAAGQYNLNIKYLSGDRNSTLLINVAGAGTGVTYNFPKTTNWDVSSASISTVSLNLPKGRVLIKFFNNYGNASPWIGDLTFALQQTPTVESINANTGTMSGGTHVVDNGYVGAIGDTGGYVTVPINITKAGIYTLGIRYISGDRDRIMKVDVNGVWTGTTYTFLKTTNWNESNSRVFDVTVTLNQGTNKIKFYNSPNSPAPWIGPLTFTQQFFYTTIEAENTTLTGTAKVNNGLVSGIGYGLGSITFGISNLPGIGQYSFIIKYVSSTSGKTARLWVNNIQIGGNHTFEVTDDWDQFKYKTITIPLNLNNNIIKIS